GVGGERDLLPVRRPCDSVSSALAEEARGASRARNDPETVDVLVRDQAAVGRPGRPGREERAPAVREDARRAARRPDDLDLPVAAAEGDPPSVRRPDGLAPGLL